MGVRHIDSCYFFFFKQKTAYEMRISDWSSDVCSSDLSVNALFVVLLTPPLILLWRRRAVRGRAFSALSRMAIGAAVVALAYASLALVATSVGDGMTSWIWLLLFLVILTFGELWILPVGLELFGRLAPPGSAATTIAAWFFAGFVGNLLAGLLGSGDRKSTRMNYSH